MHGRETMMAKRTSWMIAFAVAVAGLAAYSAGTILYIALFRRATGTTTVRLLRWVALGHAGGARVSHAES